MKLRFALALAPFLLQCSSSSASHGAADSGADASSDGSDDVSSGSSSGGVDGATKDSGEESGSGSGGGSSGGDGAVPMACTTANMPDHLSYTVSNTGGADVLTLSFDVNASWFQQQPKTSPYWSVYANDPTCAFAQSAELRLGGVLTGADGGAADGGSSLPSTALTWTIAGHDYPQSATDGAISLIERTQSVMVGSGNYWLSQGGTITGTPVGTDCYELDFANVPMAKDPALPTMINHAKGTFLVTGTARVGPGCM